MAYIERPQGSIKTQHAMRLARQLSNTCYGRRLCPLPTSAPPSDAPRLSGAEPGRAGPVRCRVSDWSHDNLNRFELNLDGSRLEPCPRDVYSQLPDKPPVHVIKQAHDAKQQRGHVESTAVVGRNTRREPDGHFRVSENCENWMIPPFFLFRTSHVFIQQYSSTGISYIRTGTRSE